MPREREIFMEKSATVIFEVSDSDFFVEVKVTLISSMIWVFLSRGPSKYSKNHCHVLMVFVTNLEHAKLRTFLMQTRARAERAQHFRLGVQVRTL